MITRHIVAVALACSVSAAAILQLSSDSSSVKNQPVAGSYAGSKFVTANSDGSLTYTPDEKGNIIPDFSRVGFYWGDKEIPDIAVVKTISPTGTEADQQLLQDAIDEVSKRPLDNNGYRGAILLKKGVYKLSNSIKIEASGVILRGEGDTEKGTKLLLTATQQMPLLIAAGSGNIQEIKGSKVQVTDAYVPVGAHSFSVSSGTGFKAGDKVILHTTTNDQWISDLRMDKIEGREGTKQWKASEYNFSFERVITRVEGNKVFIDNPVVMAIDSKYGNAELYKYDFAGRISQVGIENIFFQSDYQTDTSENHGWDAISFRKIEHSWIRNVTSRYFGYSCVNLSGQAKNISVLNSNCFDAKSVITGGRRYSFNNDGQLNLFINCHTTEGRHDFVTGARVCGPNVFYNCTAKRTHADIGPHHRWAMGTLYDNITTDGEINIQDRGNWGSGHGWAGITQVLWNCSVKAATVQNPWAGGKNYSIGLQGVKKDGRFKERNDGEWELQHKKADPPSLYMAQLKARKK
ncbi:hypothetical protein [Sediminibacterium ginsengisoli]|uniref:Pectate lyase superfamily protein n=1 Tax=Sediminibacterium ginsengisoli TaxID=413434 RepID=A0A1T4KWE6_9BACT|nr:hypothetical protein [Sediminibacterium ginsengisoli]SJZ46755.1 hypothetical protein SAMN04488132_102157 [Sediminibacterium ginsengisoli]